MVYGTSNGPQNDVGDYLGPCSNYVGVRSASPPKVQKPLQTSRIREDSALLVVISSAIDPIL